MRKNIILICLIWSAITTGSFLYNYQNALSEQKKLSLQTARSFFNQIVLFRSWNAIHGGVYVPVTADTQPNSYLDVPQREITVNRNLTLTKINPAFMTRQVSELAIKKDGVQFRMTSLLPIRPENRATQIEEAALREFEAGILEKGEIINGDSGLIFFYMASLKTEKSCLTCHAKQGYKEGDVRGGISVTIPYISKPPIFMIASVHLFMLFAGLSGLIFSGIKLGTAYNLIKRQAIFDALTGIPNRQSFSERILTEYKRSLRDNYPLSVIMGDIDNFKLYNDTYGHAGGDECLKSVAKIIASTLKRPGDFCARYGGEEFIIILPATDKTGAKVIAESIRNNIFNLNIPHEKSANEKFVTISLGIATKGNDTAMTTEELLKMADDALYTAKEKGRNRVEVFNG